MIHTIRVPGIITGLLASLLAQAAWSQQPQVTKLYERGVNAYFAGRSGDAETALSEAIQWNSQDPRAYYFRALTLLRQGRSDEARGDMLTGAMFEAQAPRRFAVGAALERVQGSERLMLERYRRDARRDAIAQASGPHSALPLATPTTFVQPEPDEAVIRQHRVVPLEELLRPEGPRPIAVEAPATPAPLPPQKAPEKSSPPSTFAPPTVSVPPAPAPAVTPATPPAHPAANPFEDDSSKQPPAAPAPPTATPATPPQPAPSQPAPAAKPQATPPAAADEDNPFGG